MRGRIKDFRIESESAVTLVLADGSSRLVPIQEIGSFVSVEDHARISKAIALRTDFITRHITPWTKAAPLLAIGILVGVGAVSAGRVVQQDIAHKQAATQAATVKAEEKSQEAPAAQTPTSASASAQPAAATTSPAPAVAAQAEDATTTPAVQPTTSTAATPQPVAKAAPVITSTVTRTLQQTTSAVKELTAPVTGLLKK